MRKKNNNWYYCNICESPMREKEIDGLCINCHLYLCSEESDKCPRCSGIYEILTLLIDGQKKRKGSSK